MDSKRTISLAALALGAVLATGGVFAAAQAKAFAPIPDLSEERKIHREEMNAEMQMTVEERLDKAIADGKITAEQKPLILAKLEEMRQKLSKLKTLPKEQWRDAFRQIHEEMQAWAKEQGIDQMWWNGNGKEPSRYQPQPRRNFGLKGDFVKFKHQI